MVKITFLFFNEFQYPFLVNFFTIKSTSMKSLKNQTQQSTTKIIGLAETTEVRKNNNSNKLPILKLE